MIISRRKFEEAVNCRAEEISRLRVEEAICKVQEAHWREEREREMRREQSELERRVIECEKKCGIDHPSHRHLVHFHSL